MGNSKFKKHGMQVPVHLWHPTAQLVWLGNVTLRYGMDIAEVREQLVSAARVAPETVLLKMVATCAQHKAIQEADLTPNMDLDALLKTYLTDNLQGAQILMLTSAAVQSKQLATVEQNSGVWRPLGGQVAQAVEPTLTEGLPAGEASNPADQGEAAKSDRGGADVEPALAVEASVASGHAADTGAAQGGGQVTKTSLTVVQATVTEQAGVPADGTASSSERTAASEGLGAKRPHGEGGSSQPEADEEASRRAKRQRGSSPPAFMQDEEPAADGGPGLEEGSEGEGKGEDMMVSVLTGMEDHEGPAGEHHVRSSIRQLRRSQVGPAPAGGPRADQGLAAELRGGQGQAAGPDGWQQLDAEIMRFATSAVPHQQEAWDVMATVYSINSAASQLWPGAHATLFGSQAMGLALPGSDVDIMVWGHAAFHGGNDKFEERRRRYSCLQQLQMALAPLLLPGHNHRVIFSKTPVLKCVLVVGGGVRVDVTVGNPEVVQSVSFVLQQCEAQLPLWPLTLIVKALLKEALLSLTYTGGLSSHCTVNLLIAHLAGEGLPPDQEAPPDAPYALTMAGHREHLDWLLQTAKAAESAAAQQGGGDGPGPGRLLWAFLERFGRRFNYSRDAISIAMGGIVRKSQLPWPAQGQRLCMADMSEERDIGAPVFRIKEVKNLFAEAADRLKRAVEGGAHRRGPEGGGSFPLLSALLDVDMAISRGEAACLAREEVAEQADAEVARREIDNRAAMEASPKSAGRRRAPIQRPQQLDVAFQPPPQLLMQQQEPAAGPHVGKKQQRKLLFKAKQLKINDKTSGHVANMVAAARQKAAAIMGRRDPGRRPPAMLRGDPAFPFPARPGHAPYMVPPPQPPPGGPPAGLGGAGRPGRGLNRVTNGGVAKRQARGAPNPGGVRRSGASAARRRASG